MSEVVTGLFRRALEWLNSEPRGAMLLACGERLTREGKHTLTPGTETFDPDAPVAPAKTSFLLLARNEMLDLFANQGGHDSGRAGG